ncbi:MAG: hypothetical protein EVJ47_06440 [Candidatus Acidulodesulfobacterium ferriphilum]|jgi:hypothetical protein|uniref:Ankyrin repeat domain-containing protein n=1 Tax=Candidatus Acidulodesulfobacterium ferriphilum TaxID=2597223 RepID=A0A519BAI1_9DELT|nr:MAG: hypothetical protein EVJ47_06440 [Candidatus Acidulodesulfobacterium ferriphilum]
MKTKKLLLILLPVLLLLTCFSLNNTYAGVLSGFGKIISNQPINIPKNVPDALKLYYHNHNFNALLLIFKKHPNQASKITTNHDVLHLIAGASKQNDKVAAEIIYIAFKYNKHLKPNHQGTVTANSEYKKRCFISATSIHYVTPIFMAAVNNLKIVYRVLISYGANPNVTSIIYHNKVVNSNNFGIMASCIYVSYKNTLSAKMANADIESGRGISLHYYSSTAGNGVSHNRNFLNVPLIWHFGNIN